MGWVEDISDIETCSRALVDNRRCWKTALANNRFEACDGFDRVRDLLFARYHQLGGTALQIGDVISKEYQESKSPESQSIYQ